MEIHTTKEMSQNMIERNFKPDSPALGTSSLNIVVVKTKDHTTLSRRISHALYDG